MKILLAALTLYRMFADKGLVVAQYIRNRRLDFCADAIRHAADDEKLAGIGFHWGFSDLPVSPAIHSGRNISSRILSSINVTTF